MLSVRKSFAFDAIFWQKLDRRFFGLGEMPKDDWEKRIGLLGEEERMSNLLCKGNWTTWRRGSWCGSLMSLSLFHGMQ